MVVDSASSELQRLRIVLYKLRMRLSVPDLHRHFFSSLADAAQLLRLFDFLPNVFLYVKDTEGRFTAMNQQLVRLRGARSVDELIGKTDVEIHPAYWGRLYQEEDRRVIESGRELPDQVWLVPVAGGRLGTFLSSKIPLRNADGKVIGIAGVMYQLEGQLPSDSRGDPVAQATEIITRGFDAALEINQVAKQVGLSVSQLNRRFRAVYQMSPSEYLQRVRVHEASRLIAESDLTIGRVALETGFYDQAHLTRTFRRWMGMPPSEFRKLSQRSRASRVKTTRS
jgi:AraC-like DNA-binding protein